MSRLWQHPYVNIFKHYNISEWKKCAKEGEVTAVMDKTLKCTVYRVTGSIPAGNYIQFPRTSTQSLGLTGRYLYVLFKPIPGKYFVTHLDVATEDGLIVRISFSNLFKEFKSTSTWLQFPFVPRPTPGSIDEATAVGSSSPDNIGHVSMSTRFTFLMLDLQYIISVYLNQKYAYLKNVRLCANMLVKGLFTSDTEYQPGISAAEARKLGLMSSGHVPVPREMAFHVPKGSCWDDLYDMIKFPAKSKHLKKAVIHGRDVNLHDKEKVPSQNGYPLAGDGNDRSRQAVASRVALVDKLSPKKSKARRRQIVATHVPPVGLQRPVGVHPEDHLDTQVYAYKPPRKTDSPHKKHLTDRSKEAIIKKKVKYSENNEANEEPATARPRRGFKSLKPDPILKLRRIVGYGGATYKEVLWTRNGACVVYPVHAVIVSMEVSTGHQRFLKGHTDKVSALTFNGNTSILASAQLGQSTVMRIWRFHSGDCIAIFNSQIRSLHCLSFSNSGGVLCGSGRDSHGKQMVVVWDTSRCGKAGEVAVIGKAHTDVDISRIKIAPFDDTRMMSCGRDNIRFWRIRHGSLRSCPVDLGSHQSVEFTDVGFGRETVDKNNKKQRRIYACTTMGTVFELNYELMAIHKVRRLLPTGSRQDLVGEHVTEVGQYGIRINCLSVNEAFCVTGSDDGYLRLWPLDFSGVVLEAEHDGPVMALDINSDGLSIVAATQTGNVGFLDIATRTYKTLMRSHTDHVLCSTFDPSRRHLVTVSRDETIRVWDLDTLCQLYDFRAPNENPCAVAFHPHQQVFACGFRNGAVRMFHIGAASMLAEHKEHRGTVTGLAFSPNGEHLYSAGSLGIMALYEGSTEEFSVMRMLVNTVARGDHFAPDVLTVSEDSQRVAVIGPSEFVVTVMDSRTLDEVLRIDITTTSPEGGRPNVDSAARICYAPASLRQLLVVTSGCRLLKLDAHAGQLLSEVTNIHRSSCSSITPYPSGQFLATAGDNVIKIWDYHMRLDLNFQVFIGHSEAITKVIFTPDHQGLVSVGEGIFIWDFLGDGRAPLEPGGRQPPKLYITDEPDNSVRVFGDVTHELDLNSQSEQRPRSPVTAAQVPSRPQPSPSPVKPNSRQTIRPSPLKQSVAQDSFNPVVTRGVTAPRNTPEKQTEVSVQNITSSLSKVSPAVNSANPSDSGHPCPSVSKHYRRRRSCAAVPARRYTAPPSQAGLSLHAVLDYNGDGRGNMTWNPETGLFVYTSGCMIIVEDLHDGKQRHFLGHMEEISTLALQHDIQCLASASGSSSVVAAQICIWEIQTGLCKKVLTYHAHEVVCLAYSRDDRFLISVGDYRECSVVIWGTKDYNVLTSSFTGDPIHDLAWDPFTVNEFASVGENGNVLFWLLDETRGSFSLNVCEAKVPDDLLYVDKETDELVHFTSVRYAGDSVLYVGSNVGVQSAWDTRQNKCFMHWEADDSEIDVIICHRGQLITGGYSGHLRLWSVVGVSEMRLPGENNELTKDGLVIEDEMSLDAGIISAAFDASLEMGIVGTVGGTLWYINWTERTSIRLVSSHTQKINSLVVSGPDDKYFATCSNDGSLRVWTTNELEQTLQFQVMSQQCKCVSFCPTPQPQSTKNLTSDGQVVATVHPHEKPAEKPVRPSHCVAGYDDGTVRLFDLGRVEMIMKIHPHAEPVTAVSFSADGRVFMSGGEDGMVAISSPATGLTVRLIKDHKGAPITTMDIAPVKEHHPSFTSPRLWLIASADRRVSVWSTDWSKDFCELVDWLTFPAPSIAPDGTSLKKADASSYYRLPPSLARFSPTEPDVIVYTGYGLKKQIQFYSLSQRKVFRSISLTQWATCLEISPKGHLMAVGTAERLVKVLDYYEGSFQDFVGHCDQISAVSFSPSGEKLFSVGFCDVLLWKVII